MFRLNRQHRQHQACLSCCALLAYAIAVIGIPLPISISKDLSTPFPCQDCACHCTTAAQCWRSCCCLSDHQKLAWAQANGVKPPEFVVRRAMEVTLLAARNKPAAACCAHTSGPARPSCCARSASPAVASADEPESKSVLLITSAAVRCQGGVQWCAQFPTISVETAAAPRATQPFLISWRRITDSVADELDPLPPTPPPKLSSLPCPARCA